MMDLEELLADLYAQRSATWENARENAKTFVKQAVGAADPDGQFVYSVVSRVKEQDRALAKLKRKVAGRFISSLSDLEEVISDWVGVKVTCNTTADAEALIVKLGDLCRGSDGIRFALSERGDADVDDYIKSPKDSGYRDLSRSCIGSSF